jgi:hypothetical protein
MDAFDRSIVRFVLAWAPYGGPHDDAACREFGLDADVIIRRFSAVVTEAVRQTHLYSGADRELLTRAWAVHKSMCLRAQAEAAVVTTSDQHPNSRKARHDRCDIRRPETVRRAPRTAQRRAGTL